MSSINRREKKIIRKRGLIPTPASGALSNWKGDGQDEVWMIEYKNTFSSQYTLKLSTWNKLEVEAIREWKRPRMEIDFDGKGYLVVLSKEDFDELVEGREEGVE